MNDESPTLNGKAPDAPDAPDAPKRRGRPPGSKNRATLDEVSLSGEAPARRGRPRKQVLEYDAESLAKQIKGGHFLIASVSGLPELIVDDKESKELAEAVIIFSREYDFTPDPKIMAIIQLAATMGFVYVPRVFAIAARMRAAKQSRPTTVDGESSAIDGQASSLH